MCQQLTPGCDGGKAVPNKAGWSPKSSASLQGRKPKQGASKHTAHEAPEDGGACGNQERRLGTDDFNRMEDGMAWTLCQ